MDFGLSHKEANVYLAMLELGPSSVQDIAKKAGVNRATTYVMLESLKRRGLMSSVDRGKKTYFAAESPEHLLYIIGEQISSVEKQHNTLKSAMPQFMALFNAVENKPEVRFFEGEEGVKACREAMIEMARGEQLPRVFIHYDEDMVKIAKLEEEKRLKMTRDSVEARILYSIDKGLSLPAFGKNVEVRKVPDEVKRFQGELDVYENFILVAVTSPRPSGVIIESKEVAGLFQSFFDLAWRCAE